MYRIAIIQFPGSNCELEAARAVRRAGMEAVIWRWNRPYQELATFDGFIVPGGFSYEDRIRAGVVAAHDQVIEVVRAQANAGKPVLGICNGAQILVEAGLVPGGTHAKDTGQVTAMLAVNKRVGSDTELLGVGYYNEWVYIRNNAPKGRSAFTLAMDEGKHLRLPVAHGEGRFLFADGILEQLVERTQTVFRYCNPSGEIEDFFPANINGAAYALAGVCNEEGNVLALMPHPERTEEGQVLFESMRQYLKQEGKGNKAVVREAGRGTRRVVVGEKLLDVRDELSRMVNETETNDQVRSVVPESLYRVPFEACELLVALKITDTTADTLSGVLAQAGLVHVSIRRWIHWEIVFEQAAINVIIETNTESFFAIVGALIKSDELLNMNKETPFIRIQKQWYTYDGNRFMESVSPVVNTVRQGQIFQDSLVRTLMVRDYDDFQGQQVVRVLHERFNFTSVAAVVRSVVWHMSGLQADKAVAYLIARDLLANPVGQEIKQFE